MILLWLHSFTSHAAFRVHACYSIYPHIPHCMYPNHQLGCFHFGATMNNTNTCVQDLTGTDVFYFSEYVSRDVIAGLYGNSMSNLSWNCQTVLQNDCIISCCHQRYMRVPVVHIIASTHYVFLVIVVLMCVKCYFSEVLICIFPLHNDIGYLSCP